MAETYKMEAEKLAEIMSDEEKAQIKMDMAIEKAVDRDNFMSPEEAKKFGLIDEIVKSRSDVIK